MIVIKKILDLVFRHWPVYVAIILLGICIINQTSSIKSRNEGHFNYAIDDPYIHMAISKNIVEHNIWGVTKYEYSFSSSSPLWTIMLSGIFWMIGEKELAPFFMNLLCAVILLIITYLYMRQYYNSRIALCIFLALFTFVVPIPALVFFGMEHILQIIIDIALIVIICEILTRDKKQTTTQLLLLGLFSALCVLVRYEGLFIVFIGVTFLLIYGKIRPALVCLLASLIPLFILGFWQINHDGLFFPNPVLLKGSAPSISSGVLPLIVWLYHKIYYFEFPTLYSSSTFLLLLFFFLLIMISMNWMRIKSRMDAERFLFGLIVSGVMLMHVVFAEIVYYYRYDAYLAALGLIAAAINLQLLWPIWLDKISSLKHTGKRLAYYVIVSMLIAYIMIPIGNRGRTALKMIPHYAHNIYQQQIHMAEFLEEYFPSESVVANDIGAISFYTDIRLIDLWGLGSVETTKAVRGGYFTRQFIDQLTSNGNGKIAMVHKKAFDRSGGLPEEWTAIGEWRNLDNIICWDDTVTFYAIDPIYIDRLRSSLQEFESELPYDVIFTDYSSNHP